MSTREIDDIETPSRVIDSVIPSPAAQTRPRNSLFERVSLGTLLAFGVIMRIWILLTPLGRADSDESVVGLMARALLDGDPTVYYWGQPYGGSQEAMLVASTFAVFGSSVLALKMTSIILSAAAAWFIWRIGLRTVGPRAAMWGASLFWAAPFAFVWLSTKERGFYQVTMLCGLAVILFALRLRQQQRAIDAAALGFAAGLGVWASPQVAYLLVPTVLWLIVTTPRTLRLLWAAAPAFLLGMTPALQYNFVNDWRSLDVPPISNAGSYADRIEKFLTIGLPMALGLKIPYRNEWTLPLGGLTFLVASSALIIPGVRRFWTTKTAEGFRSNIGLLLVVVLAYPFIFAFSPYSSYVNEPRYIYFLSPALTLLVAWIICRSAARFIAGALACALCATSLVALLQWPTRWDNHDLVTEDLTPLVKTLEQSGHTRVFADYWIAYRVTFVTRERVVAAPITQIRRAEIQQEVETDSKPSTYVFFRDSRQDQAFRSQMESRGVHTTESVVGHFRIYVLDRRLTPSQIDISTLVS